MPEELHDFSAERQGRYLQVQRLDREVSWPCKTDGDSCLLPGEWIVIDGGGGLCALACHEHISQLLWQLWPGI